MERLAGRLALTGGDKVARWYWNGGKTGHSMFWVEYDVEISEKISESYQTLLSSKIPDSALTISLENSTWFILLRNFIKNDKTEVIVVQLSKDDESKQRQVRRMEGSKNKKKLSVRSRILHFFYTQAEWDLQNETKKFPTSPLSTHISAISTSHLDLNYEDAESELKLLNSLIAKRAKKIEKEVKKYLKTLEKKKSFGELNYYPLNAENIGKISGLPLAKGHFGSVYQTQLQVDSNIAIKTISSLRSLNQNREVFREISALKSIPPHKHVVKFYGFRYEKNSCSLLFELVPDGNLLAYLKSHSLDFLSKLKLCHQISLGLKHIHANSIVHRDLALRNILFDATKFRAKISDFGLSRSFDPQTVLQMTHTRIAPLRWIPPETMPWVESRPRIRASSKSAKTIDPYLKYSLKTDIWAIAIVFYEIFSLNGDGKDCGLYDEELTERLKSATEEEKKILETVNEGPPPTKDQQIFWFVCNDSKFRLKKKNEISEVLWKLMLKCWEKQQENRPNIGDICKLLKSEIATKVNVEVFRRSLYGKSNVSKPNPEAPISIPGAKSTSSAGVPILVTSDASTYMPIGTDAITPIQSPRGLTVGKPLVSPRTTTSRAATMDNILVKKEKDEVVNARYSTPTKDSASLLRSGTVYSGISPNLKTKK